MDACYDDYEVVHVTRGFQLFDSEAWQRRYQRSDGRALAPGYYVVDWPARCTCRRFDAQARFRGPYHSAQEAQALAGYWKNLDQFLEPAGDWIPARVNCGTAPVAARK